MNRRLEDDIARMAFGDLPPERVEELRRQAESDAEVARALAAYSGLRDGLRSLSPAVEHQLSTERLRHEILHRGLAPRTRPLFDLRWLMLPVAAAGAFLVMQSIRNGPSGPTGAPAFVQGPVEATPRVALRAPDSGPDPSERVVTTSPRSPLASEPSEPIRRVAVSSPPKAAPGNRRAVSAAQPETRVAMRETTRSEPTAFEAVLGGGAGAAMKADSPATVAAAVASEAADAAPTASLRAEPIVVIQPDRDVATGAYRATEVASPSNVLIGS